MRTGTGPALVRVIAKVTRVKTVIYQQTGLPCYRDVMRREETHITRSTPSMKMPGT